MTDTCENSELRNQVRSFVSKQREVGTFTPQCDAWHTGFSLPFSRALAERGWVGMTMPEDVGGRGGSYSDRLVVAEELLAAGAPVAAHWITERQIAPAILRLGTEEQQHRFLPPIIKGKMVFALGMSEPDSGSDLASIKTRARPAEDGWILSGQKVWTSLASSADYVLVLCRTSPSESKHEGLSQLLVSCDWPGVTVRPIVTTTGHGHFCEVFFDDVHVPSDHLLGDEGQGWRQIVSELAYERGGPERYLSTFPLFAAYVDALHESSNTEAARAIGELTAQFAALRSLTVGLCAAMDAGGEFGKQAALSKDAGTKFEQRLVQVLRRCELTEVASRPVIAELFRQATLASPTFTLRGGTTEVLRGIIARELIA